MDCSLPGSSDNWIFKNTGVGCHFLVQGIFLTHGSNTHLLHWQADSLPLSCQGSPRHIEVAGGSFCSLKGSCFIFDFITDRRLFYYGNNSKCKLVFFHIFSTRPDIDVACVAWVSAHLPSPGKDMVGYIYSSQHEMPLNI